MAGLGLHASKRHAIARCVWLGAGNVGVFLGANLIDPIGDFDLILVAAMGVPFLVFSWRNERVLMLIFTSLPIALWGITWVTDFRLFGFHEVGQAIAHKYIALPSALTVFAMVAIEIGYFAIITARHEDSLKKALVAAENANKAKSEFLSSMSHELRTPLNGILGFAQLLSLDAERDLSPEQREYVDNILSSGNLLLELINQVLDLAKIETGEGRIVITDVDVGKTVQDCLPAIERLASRRGVNLDIRPVPGSLSVRADPLCIKQILLNLMSNAVKYNREGGKVHLTYVADGDGRLRLSVCDTGPGIAADDLDKVFEPFHRLNASNSKIDGTGIGLSITKRLVEQMDGSIGVQSELGEGSTFWVMLRLSESPIA